jgi:predicted transcriptional regulator
MHVLNDTVPKIIGHFLVRQSQDILQMVLFNELNQEQILETLGEPKEVEEERKRLNIRIQTLAKSLKALKDNPTVSKLIAESKNDDDDDTK